MLQLSAIFKPALGLAVVGLMTLGASADHCPLADSMGLSDQQRQQLYQITQGGSLNNPAVQQQVLSVLTPVQQAQLQQWNQGQCQNQVGGQGQRRHRGQNSGYCNNAGNYNGVGNATGSCPTNQSQVYYPNQSQGYYPNQNNGANLGINILSGLLNSGILNGVFNNMNNNNRW